MRRARGPIICECDTVAQARMLGHVVLCSPNVALGPRDRYCGLSFLPALPWKTVEVPPYVPRLDVLVLGGLLNFENHVWHRASVWGACAVVAAMPLVFFCVRHDVGRWLLAVQVCFDVLSFPIINKMTSVFACTSDKLRDESFADRPVASASHRTAMGINAASCCHARP